MQFGELEVLDYEKVVDLVHTIWHMDFNNYIKCYR